jgi:hypothetical protein
VFQPHPLIQNPRIGEVLRVHGKERAKELCAHGVLAFLENLAVKSLGASTAQEVLSNQAVDIKVEAGQKRHAEDGLAVESGRQSKVRREEWLRDPDLVTFS